MNNDIKNFFGGIEVISFNAEGERDSKTESQLPYPEFEEPADEDRATLNLKKGGSND